MNSSKGILLLCCRQECSATQMDLHIHPSQKPTEAWKLNKSINTIFPFGFVWLFVFFFPLIKGFLEKRGEDEEQQ